MKGAIEGNFNLSTYRQLLLKLPPTSLQVLISIQSLILCSEPYYNEPGYERMYGTPQGDSESLKYSEEVFKNNLRHAIIGQLQNPPEGFEQVSFRFFKTG